MIEPEAGFTGRTPRPSRFRIAAVLGASLAVVVAAAVTMGASPSPSGTNGAGASASPGSSGTPTDPGRRGGFGDLKGFGDFKGFAGFGGDRGGRGGFGQGIGRDITISAINGSKVSLKTDDGWSRTITVATSTKITKGGAAAALADLAVGDEIRFRQTRASDGTYTIDAIEVVVPTVAGTVTAVDADSITIKARKGATREIATTASTKYRFGSAAGSRADVVVGATIFAAGTVGSNDAFTATSVTVSPARAMGKVTAKTASTITFEQRGGTSVTVKVDADTTYQVAGITDADLGDVAVGMQIVVSGRDSGTNAIDASAVFAGTIGRGHHGGTGDGKPGKVTPSANPDASSNDG